MSTKKAKNEIGIIAVSACLAAFSVIFGKFLNIPIGDTIRLSFENLPILLAGFYFGPVSGVAVAVVADIVGCFLRGYAINPVITLGAALIGLCAGAFGRLSLSNKLIKILFVVIPAHFFGSILVKTIGLIVYYFAPAAATFGWRLLTYAIISAVETAVLYLLISNRAFDKEMRKIRGGE